MTVRYEVYDDITSVKMGEEEGFMGCFETLEAARTYIDEHGHLFDDPLKYYIKDLETGEIIMDLWLSFKEKEIIETGAAIKGQTTDQFINQVVKDYITEAKEKKMRIASGQLYRYKDGESDTYMLGYMNLGESVHTVLINCDTGNVATVWDNDEDAVREMELVAENIHEYSEFEEDDDEDFDNWYDENSPLADEEDEELEEIDTSDDEVFEDEDDFTLRVLLEKVLYVPVDGDGGVYEILEYQNPETRATIIEFKYWENDSSWTRPGKTAFTFCTGNFIMSEGADVFDFMMLNDYITRYKKKSDYIGKRNFAKLEMIDEVS